MGFSWENVCSIIVLIIMGMLGESVASVHKVGGSAGWTILGKVDYNKWTSSDTFTVGDSLCNVIHTSTFFIFFLYIVYFITWFITPSTVFVYSSQFHNVKQVSRRDFLSCNATSAMATYSSGSDTVALTRPGHLATFSAASLATAKPARSSMSSLAPP